MAYVAHAQPIASIASTVPLVFLDMSGQTCMCTSI